MMFITYLLVLTFIWTGSMAAKSVVSSCNQHMFDSNVDNCLSDFNRSMDTSGYHDRCPWPAVKSIYNKLKHCVDDWANASWCWGFRVDQVFLKVHHTYFPLCGQIQDPPTNILIMFIAPVIIATLFLPVLCATFTTWNTEMPSTLGL